MLAAAVISVLVAAAGFAVDYYGASAARARLQSALDAGVLAAAGLGNERWRAEADRIMSLHLPADEWRAADVDIVKTEGKVEGFAARAYPTFFGAFLDAASVNVSVRSVAVFDEEDEAARVCVLVKNSTASQALLMNSGASLFARDCEINVASTAGPAAVFNGGATIEASRTCIAGTRIINNGGRVANLELGCKVARDPFEGKLPVPDSRSCTYSNLNFNGGNVVMRPGVYCGWINMNSGTNVRFEPGTYIIRNGGWNVNGGSFAGDGVTFYFADQSKIQFNSAVKAELKAPTSGPFAGVLFAETENIGRSQFIMNTSRGHELEGLIYLPSRELVLNAGSHATLDRVTLVVDRMIINNSSWHVSPAPGREIAADGAAPAAGATAGVARLVR